MDNADNVQRVPLALAAHEIGCCVPYLRQQMKLKEWDLGTVVKNKYGKKYNYFVFREKLDMFLGKRGQNA